MHCHLVRTVAGLCCYRGRSHMQRLLGPWNPALRGDQKAELVAGLCRDLRGGAEAPEVFITFLKMLAEFHRLHQLPGIAVLFERLRAEAESTLHAQLISAAAITDAQRKRRRQGAQNEVPA